MTLQERRANLPIPLAGVKLGIIFQKILEQYFEVIFERVKNIR